MIETVNRSKAGEDIPIEATANYVQYGNKKYNCAVVRDITERKRIIAQMSELNREMLKLSITDGLTGLSNRRHFDGALAREYDKHSRSKAPLSLILLDVDLFKAFNDLYGHLCGDDCLRQIAKVLALNMRRAGDVAARYGGEEFACILPNTDQAGASSVAEAIRGDIAKLAIRHAASPLGDRVTASLGVVTAECMPGGSTGAVLAAADSLLYEAKAKGRNRVVHGVLPSSSQAAFRGRVPTVG